MENRVEADGYQWSLALTDTVHQGRGAAQLICKLSYFSEHQLQRRYCNYIVKVCNRLSHKRVGSSSLCNVSHHQAALSRSGEQPARVPRARAYLA